MRRRQFYVKPLSWIGAVIERQAIRHAGAEWAGIVPLARKSTQKATKTALNNAVMPP